MGQQGLTMSDLPEPVETRVWGNADRVLHFDRTEDVTKWVENELQNWTLKQSPSHRQLGQAWDSQRNGLQQIANFARQLEPLISASPPPSERAQQDITQTLNHLRNSLTPIAQGTLLTAEHPSYRFIADLAQKDADAAAMLLLAWRSDGTQAISRLAPPAPLDVVVRIGVDLAESGEKSGDIDAYRRQLASVGNETGKTLAGLREMLKKEAAAAEQLATEHTDRVEGHERDWKDLVEKCNGDWNELKALYDEKLSLLAPTDYWTTQATRYKSQGIWYAVAFSVVLLASIVLFAIFGIDELKNTEAPSALIAILPVLVPAFAGIWVLRILGRQLAENLSMMKDANERVTLVKTFLALMRDETAGKAVVKEEDRALILHALFRQSRITAVDDSPPINAFEAIYRYGRPH
jgi:hypothetical protein